MTYNIPTAEDSKHQKRVAHGDAQTPAWAVEVVIPGVPLRLSYRVPAELESVVDVGSEVDVDVGRRRSSGWVVKRVPLSTAMASLENSRSDAVGAPQLRLFTETSAPKLRAIENPRPAFTPEQLSLFEWMEQYYGAPLADIIENAVPRRTSTKRKRRREDSEAETSALKPVREQPPSLHRFQQEAVEYLERALQARTFSPFLLFGVTGSGKTEVYLQTIERVLREEEGSALLIVPEISLTPQLLDTFASRLKHPVGMLHSQMGASARWETWEAIRRGELRLAVGARSAVFAPLTNLRLIIVDEEHDSSFKQSESLRYHARDVAVMRAKFAAATIILGSATPSFESLVNVKRKHYRLLEMPERVTTRPLPKLELVDLNQVKRREMISENLSPRLHQAIVETLGKKEQVIILHNRRGFSSYLQCESCSEAVKCPNCSVTLTYHKRKSRLVCHYCDAALTPPEHCSYCRDPRTTGLELDVTGSPIASERETSRVGELVHRGGGTERIVEELSGLFPNATIARMDRDAVEDRSSYARILGDVRTGQTNILVGTQMIAKGHDLPGVTLVGIIDADVGLHFPDFRSSEKVFQLITQAAGRAGRGSEPGLVIVQTREPNHPTIVATVTNRFKAFARYELEHRRALGYPPWGRLLRLVVSAPDRRRAQEAATKLRLTCEVYASRATPSQLTLLGPTPAPYEKLRARYRYHLLVKSPSAKRISQLANHLYRERSTLFSGEFAQVRLAIDVDAVDML